MNNISLLKRNQTWYVLCLFLSDETSPVLKSHTFKKGIGVSVFLKTFQGATTLLLQSCYSTGICKSMHNYCRLTAVNEEFNRKICAKYIEFQSCHPSDLLVPLSVCRVWVTGVQTSLCRRGAAALCGSRVVQSLCASPETLQRLKEGPSRPLFLQRRSPFFLHFGDLRKSHRLGLEAGVSGPSGTVSAPSQTLGDGQLLGKLLHGGRQDVCG